MLSNTQKKTCWKKKKKRKWEQKHMWSIQRLYARDITNRFRIKFKFFTFFFPFSTCRMKTTWQKSRTILFQWHTRTHSRWYGSTFLFSLTDWKWKRTSWTSRRLQKAIEFTVYNEFVVIFILSTERIEMNKIIYYVLTALTRFLLIATAILSGEREKYRKKCVCTSTFP